MPEQKTCFVIQGFGKKQDYTDGRTLDLDASYEVIKEAVTEAGLRCVRADEIKHSGTIDKPMFEQILEADLVVADLSTYNVNAAYELGVRHALRPFSTIIVAEKKFKNPFDFSHISIRNYEHLGEDIGRREAKRFKTELADAIRAILAAQATDSPVYDFVQGLQPPQRARAVQAAVEAAAAAVDAATVQSPAMEPVALSLKAMSDAARSSMQASDFVTAKGILLSLHRLAPSEAAVTQQLALATYKSGQPTPDAALLEAREYLLELEPDASHDTETLGLWGAVHKRLWDRGQQREHLDEAIRGYERGFQLKQDYYNGINLAFLLNVRAQLSPPAEAIADWVVAERVRRRVTEICTRELEALPPVSDAMPAEERREVLSRRYWILATLREAAVGLGDAAGAAAWHAEAAATAPAAWMLDSTDQQVAKLEALLANSPLSRLQTLSA
jgi:hypothetical protein